MRIRQTKKELALYLEETYLVVALLASKEPSDKLNTAFSSFRMWFEAPNGDGRFQDPIILEEQPNPFASRTDWGILTASELRERWSKEQDNEYVILAQRKILKWLDKHALEAKSELERRQLHGIPLRWYKWHNKG